MVLKKFGVDWKKNTSLSMPNGACNMIRPAFLKDLSGFNESFSYQDGYKLWIKPTAHHNAVNITEPIF